MNERSIIARNIDIRCLIAVLELQKSAIFAHNDIRCPFQMNKIGGRSLTVKKMLNKNFKRNTLHCANHDIKKTSPSLSKHNM